MKIIKKYKTVALLLVVAVLYGVIGLRIKDSVSIDNKIKYSEKHSATSVAPEVDKENEELDIDYRNPFVLKSKFRRNRISKGDNNNNQKKSNKSITNKKPISEETINNAWSNIKLRAIISDDNNKVCVIEIENSEAVVKESGIVGDYQVVNIFKDSVSILYGEELKVFRL